MASGLTSGKSHLLGVRDMSERRGGRGPTACRTYEAMCLLEQALAALDKVDVPRDIGAYIDLAICRLREINDR